VKGLVIRCRQGLLFPFVFSGLVAAFPAVNDVLPDAQGTGHLADRAAVEHHLQHLLLEGRVVLATTHFSFHLDLLR